jgi:hypothetical protein
MPISDKTGAASCAAALRCLWRARRKSRRVDFALFVIILI